MKITVSRVLYLAPVMAFAAYGAWWIAAHAGGGRAATHPLWQSLTLAEITVALLLRGRKPAGALAGILAAYLIFDLPWLTLPPMLFALLTVAAVRGPRDRGGDHGRGPSPGGQGQLRGLHPHPAGGGRGRGRGRNVPETRASPGRIGGPRPVALNPGDARPIRPRVRSDWLLREHSFRVCPHVRSARVARAGKAEVLFLRESASSELLTGGSRITATVVRGHAFSARRVSRGTDDHRHSRPNADPRGPSSSPASRPARGPRARRM